MGLALNGTGLLPAVGKYIAFEGPSRSGKTTQVRLLEELLRRMFPDREIVVTREPGAGPGQSSIADVIRDIVQGRIAQSFREQMTFMAEVYLYAASRAQTLRAVVLPALSRGAIVIADRCFVSSVAFQGGGRELGLQQVLGYNQLAVTAWLEFHKSPGPAWDRYFRWTNPDFRVGSNEIAGRIHRELVQTRFQSEAVHPITNAYLLMACLAQAQQQGRVRFPSFAHPTDWHPRILPDVIVHMDISPEEIHRRELDVAGDKFEGLGPDFHGRVCSAYHKARGMGLVLNWIRIDGNPPAGLSPEELAAGKEGRIAGIHERIKEALLPHLA
jgi:dTMP kinase